MGFSRVPEDNIKIFNEKNEICMYLLKCFWDFEKCKMDIQLKENLKIVTEAYRRDRYN